MKKLLSIALLMTLIIMVCSPALAWNESWLINPTDKGVWKKGPNHTMPDSGSFWRGMYVNGNYTTSSAYIYKSQTGRASHIEDFPKGTDRTALNYLSTKIVGDTYWLVAKNAYNTYVNYDYDF